MSKINWVHARTDYIADQTQSYASIAKKYGVSDVAVENHAKKEKWQELRKISLAKVGEVLVQKKIKTIAELNAQHEAIGESITIRALKEIQEKDYRPKGFRSAVSAINAGINISRKARGMDRAIITGPTINVLNVITDLKKKHGF